MNLKKGKHTQVSNNVPLKKTKTKQKQTINKTSTINVAMEDTHSPIKYVINLFSNVCSKAQELPIDAMESGL